MLARALLCTFAEYCALLLPDAAAAVPFRELVMSLSLQERRCYLEILAEGASPRLGVSGIRVEAETRFYWKCAQLRGSANLLDDAPRRPAPPFQRRHRAPDCPPSVTSYELDSSRRKAETAPTRSDANLAHYLHRCQNIVSTCMNSFINYICIL